MKKLLCMLLLVTPLNLFADSVMIEFENDVLYDTDAYYTHGTRITYEHNELFWSIGQNMYTPTDITVPTPLTNDRPYAGILYVALNGTKYWKEPYYNPETKRGMFHQLEVAVGVSGQYSGSEEAQILFHKLIDAPEPMGWDYQTPDRFLLQVDGKLFAEVYKNKFINTALYYGFEAGTIFGNCGFGADIIAGYNIPRSIHKPMISELKELSIYGFMDVQDKFVYWNKLLESDYTDITPTHDFVDLRIGIGVTYEYFTIQCAKCTRTEEFEEQLDPPTFGSLMLKYSF